MCQCRVRDTCIVVAVEEMPDEGLDQPLRLDKLANEVNFITRPAAHVWQFALQSREALCGCWHHMACITVQTESVCLRGDRQYTCMILAHASASHQLLLAGDLQAAARDARSAGRRPVSI